MNDWENKLHGKLKALPALSAPASLMPMVMARVEAQTRWAWWAQTASTRAASLAALALSAAGVAFGATRLLSLLPRAPLVVPTHALGALAEALGRSLFEVLGAFGEPLLIPVALAYLFCAGGVVAVWQMSSRPRSARPI